MKLQLKLNTYFLVFILFIIPLMVLRYQQENTTAKIYSEVIDHNFAELSIFSRMHSSVLRITASTSEYGLLSMAPAEKRDEKALEEELGLIEKGKNNFVAALDAYARLGEADDITEHETRLAAIKASWTRLKRSSDDLVASALRGSGSDTIKLKEEMEASEKELLGILNTALASEEIELSKSKARMAQILERNKWVSVINMFALIFMLLSLNIFFSRKILLPIKKLSETSMKIIDGDYSARAAIFQDDEIGELTNTMNSMAEHIGLTKNLQEQRAKEREKEFRAMKKLHDLTIDRELKMAEMKKQMKDNEKTK